MMAPGDTSIPDPTAVSKLLDSEHRYFLAGSFSTTLLHGVLSVAPGCESLPAGCVMHAVDADKLPADIRAWTRALESVFRQNGSKLCRFYLHGDVEHVRSALEQLGFAAVIEVGLHIELDSSVHSGWTDADLRPVESDRDWERKAELYADWRSGPDGHDMQDGLYARFERAKCEAGYMRSFLYWDGAQPVAAVSLAIANSYGRLKNLVVDPARQNQGLGLRVSRALLGEAVGQAASQLGTFARKGGPAEALYRKCGLTKITCQTEWTRPIT